jgi:hypothetical protein
MQFLINQNILSKKKIIKYMIRFICAQPSDLHYSWQIEVMLNNFIEMGVDIKYVDIVSTKKNNKIPEIWKKLLNRYSANFFFYDDTRITKDYVSSIRPNILKQHWKTHPELKTETIFYHDCDIIFTNPIQEWITDYMINDNKWYGSDTVSYIGYNYILSKGDDILDKMCEIINIDKELVKSNEKNSIGAQYLMKGIDYSFWENVEHDSERLYKEINLINILKKQSNPSYHELQIWCADMWAVLWNAWKLNHETICHTNFKFSWAKTPEIEYLNRNIMHNAGIKNDDIGFFQKSKYVHHLPYNLNLKIKEGTSSKKYYEWVQKTEKKSVLLKNSLL